MAQRNPETGVFHREPTDLKAINYIELIPVLVRSINDQQDYIQALEKRIGLPEGE